MLPIKNYLKNMSESEANIRILNDNLGGFYFNVIFLAECNTYTRFKELNSEYTVEENIEFFCEKNALSPANLVSSEQLKKVFNEYIGRDIYECELNYFANCDEQLRKLK